MVCRRRKCAETPAPHFFCDCPTMMTDAVLMPKVAVTEAEIDAFCATLTGRMSVSTGVVRALMAERGYVDAIDRENLLARLSTPIALQDLCEEVWP